MNVDFGLLLIEKVLIVGFGKADKFRTPLLGDFNNALKSSNHQLKVTLLVLQSHGRQIGKQVIGPPELKAERPTPVELAGDGQPMRIWKASPIWIGGVDVVIAVALLVGTHSDTERRVEIRLSGPGDGSVQVVLVDHACAVEAVTSLLGAGDGICRAKVCLVDVLDVLFAAARTQVQSLCPKGWTATAQVEEGRNPN